MKPVWLKSTACGPAAAKITLWIPTWQRQKLTQLWTVCHCQLHHFRGCWTRLPATLPIYVYATVWYCSAFSALAANPYNTTCVFLCMVPLTGVHQTTSPIWLHWHELRQAGHIFALPTAYTFDVPPLVYLVINVPNLKFLASIIPEIWMGSQNLKK